MRLEDWAQGVSEGLDKVLPSPEQMPTVQVKKATDFYSAPGWREVTVEYTCIPDSVYPWDPQIMRQIREYVPDAVPIWVRWVFRSPQDTEDPHDVVFGRHAIGRSIRAVRTEQIPFQCDMPTMPCQGLHFDRPNTIWFIHEGVRPTERYVDLPGEYLPFDQGLLEKVKLNSVGFRMTDKEYTDHLREEMITGPMREAEKRRAAVDDDMEQRRKEIQPYLQRMIEGMSDVEVAEFLARQRMVPSQ